MWKTRRYACWLTQESSYFLIKDSQEDSVLHRVMESKRPSADQICDLTAFLTNPDELNNFDLMKAFFVMNKSALYIFFLSSSGSPSASGKFMFETSLFNYELVQVHFLAKSLDGQLKKEILKR